MLSSDCRNSHLKCLEFEECRSAYRDFLFAYCFLHKYPILLLWEGHIRKVVDSRSLSQLSEFGLKLHFQSDKYHLHDHHYLWRSWNRASLDVYFIQPTRWNLHSVLYYYQRSTCFGRFSAYHQELIKLYLQPWVLSCFPAVYRWCGWVGMWMGCSNQSTPAVDSRKAWQTPRLHIHFYELLMMGVKTARNMYSVDNNKEHCVSFLSLVI